MCECVLYRYKNKYKIICRWCLEFFFIINNEILEEKKPLDDRLSLGQIDVSASLALYI